MKRIVAIFLTITTIFFLCSCSFSAYSDSTFSDSITQTSTETTDASVSDIVVTQKPLYAISLPPVHESAKDKDGNVVFNCTYQNISLILPEPEVADKIILDFLNKTDAVTKAAADMKNTAEEAYKNSPQSWMLQMRYAPTRFDSSILSLYGEKVCYSGSAHSLNFGQSVTYDLLTGKALDLVDILCLNVTENTLCDLVIESLDQISDQVDLKSSYKEIVTQIFNEGLEKCERWYFSQNGLCFYFDIYEIAPYTAGCVTAEIPYSKLTGVVKDAYFPAENDPISGTVSAKAFSEDALHEFTQFAEIVLDENSKKILFYTDSAVSNIRIRSIESTTSGEPATDQDVVFAAYTLTPGDAIMLEVDPTNNLLQFSYQTGTETVHFSVIITDDTIQLIKI